MATLIIPGMKPLRNVLACLWLLTMPAGATLAPDSDVDPAATLRESYARLRDALAHSPFGEPMTLESSDVGDLLRGQVHALIDRPYAGVRSVLVNAGSWCDILVLHPNIMGCRHRDSLPGGDASVRVLIGKSEQAADFAYHVAADTSAYLDVRLSAPAGPLGTSDYRIRLEAAPLDERRTILHLTYSNRYGAAARIAMRVYLETLGRGKAGFTVVGRNADGSPVYVGDLRGAQERNAMRYYLAITAYLESLSANSKKDSRSGTRPVRDTRRNCTRTASISTSVAGSRKNRSSRRGNVIGSAADRPIEREDPCLGPLQAS